MGRTERLLGLGCAYAVMFPLLMTGMRVSIWAGGRFSPTLFDQIIPTALVVIYWLSMIALVIFVGRQLATYVPTAFPWPALTLFAACTSIGAAAGANIGGADASDWWLLVVPHMSFGLLGPNPEGSTIILDQHMSLGFPYVIVLILLVHYRPWKRLVGWRRTEEAG